MVSATVATLHCNITWEDQCALRHVSNVECPARVNACDEHDRDRCRVADFADRNRVYFGDEIRWVQDYSPIQIFNDHGRPPKVNGSLWRRWRHDCKLSL